MPTSSAAIRVVETALCLPVKCAVHLAAGRRHYGTELWITSPGGKLYLDEITFKKVVPAK